MANKRCRCGVKCSIAPVNYLHDIFNTLVRDCESDVEPIKVVQEKKRWSKGMLTWTNYRFMIDKSRVIRD